jgi:hypothetical protein
MDTINIIILSLSALLLIFVGFMRLTNPIKTYLNNSGITLNQDTDLLNELKGASTVQLCSGIIIALGIFSSELVATSFTVAILFFLGFALGRIVSMLTDGKPNKQLVQGLIFELVFGAANVYGLLSIL